MKLSTKYKAKGIFRVAMGTVKGVAAKVRMNRTLGVKGKFDKIAGKMQWRIGKAQAFIGL